MKKLIGGVLLAIGILIAGASGLCSLVFFLGSFQQGGLNVGGMVIVVGGIPFLIGCGLVMAGRALLRSAAIDAGLEGDGPGPSQPGGGGPHVSNDRPS